MWVSCIWPWWSAMKEQQSQQKVIGRTWLFPPSLGSLWSQHLREVPALDEVAGKVPGSCAMYNHSDIPPWHPGCGLSVNKIWKSQES